MESKKVKIAIVGSSGRSSPDNTLLSLKHFQYAKSCVLEYIKKLNIKQQDVILVSGGSAWMDHVAASLYLDGGFGGLTLYLPTLFDSSEEKFNTSSREGITLNDLHKKFSSTSEIDSLRELAVVYENYRMQTAKHNSAKIASQGYVTIAVKSGFLARNTLIAQNCDHLLAFTFADKTSSISGGTKDTWNKVVYATKVHYSLMI